MRKRILVVSALAVAFLTGSVPTVASAQGQPPKPPVGTHRMEGMHMGDNMMGMMDMMGSCKRMMQGGMTGHMLPQLPPGNEKLQLQMQAEMMQKMGEIVAKYAAQIKEEKK